MKKKVEIKVQSIPANFKLIMLGNSLQEVDRALLSNNMNYFYPVAKNVYGKGYDKRSVLNSYFKRQASEVPSPSIVNFSLKHFVDVIKSQTEESCGKRITNTEYIEDISHKLASDLNDNLDFVKGLCKDINLENNVHKYITIDDNPIAFGRDNHFFWTCSRVFTKLVDTLSYHDINRNVIAFHLFQSLYKLIKHDNKVIAKDLKLGADPEFMIYEKEQGKQTPDYTKLIPAEHLIGSHGGELGCDGHSVLGELRPQPSNNPEQVAKNIKRLFERFENEIGKNQKKELFLEAGGGCARSIGGHIHFGHPAFLNMGEKELTPFLTMLDDFIYYPLKTSMLGGVRYWQNFDEIQKRTRVRNGSTELLNGTTGVIDSLKKVDLKSQPDVRFESYDTASAHRMQNHGLEYRSLPSFIGDYTLTTLVFKLAKNIALRFFEMQVEKTSLEYENPPEKKDYELFLSKDEVATLFEYLEGSKKDLFLKNILDNWGIERAFSLSIYDAIGWYPREFVNRLQRQLISEFKEKLEPFTKRFNITLYPSDYYYPESVKRKIPKFFIATDKKIIGSVTKYGRSSFGFNEYDILVAPPKSLFNAFMNTTGFAINTFRYAINLYLKYKDQKQDYKYITWLQFKKTSEYKELGLDKFLSKKKNAKVKKVESSESDNRLRFDTGTETWQRNASASSPPSIDIEYLEGIGRALNTDAGDED